MTVRRLSLSLAALVWGAAQAQTPPGPPAVGVVRATREAITQTSEFIGRIQAVDRVSLTARVTAFLTERLFTEGAEVTEGDLLYRLERAPFEAAVAQQEAAVADTTSRLANANIQLARAQSLLNTPAGQRSTVDDAVANQRSQAAQVAAAQAQLRMAKINLAYTEIHAPISGIVDVRAALRGEVVSPGKGIVTLIDPDNLWVRADVEETYIDLVHLGDTMTVRLPSGAERTCTVFYRRADADYATQRDVSRAKRDIKTFEIRLRCDNADRSLAVGMTAYVNLPLATDHAKPRSSG